MQKKDSNVFHVTVFLTHLFTIPQTGNQIKQMYFCWVIEYKFPRSIATKDQVYVIPICLSSSFSFLKDLHIER